jgi:hypothetical protein
MSDEIPAADEIIFVLPPVVPSVTLEFAERLMQSKTWTSMGGIFKGIDELTIDNNRFDKIFEDVNKYLAEYEYGGPIVEEIPSENYKREDLHLEEVVDLELWEKSCELLPELKHENKITENMNEDTVVKIVDLYPRFLYGNLLDDVLEELGGIQEILSCEWDQDMNAGTVACLMKDWRVTSYYLKANDFSALSGVERMERIKRECMVHEDMDDWGHYLELANTEESRQWQYKRDKETKEREEEQKQDEENYTPAVNDFFNGSVDKIAEMMKKAMKRSIPGL